MEGMGSILLLGFFTAICAIIALILCLFKCKIPCKTLRKILKPNRVLQSSLLFMLGAFFEILVCVSISMKMLTYYEQLNRADHMSLAFQFIFLLAILTFIGFIIDFAFRVSPKLVTMTKGKQFKSKQEHLKKIHEKFELKQSRRNSKKGQGLNFA